MLNDRYAGGRVGDQGEADVEKRVELAQTSWARLLFALLSQRFTGRTDFELAGQRHGTVVFVGGFCVWSDWSAESTGLAELLRRGAAQEGDDVVAQLAAEHGDSPELVTALFERGALEEERTRVALRDQAERRAEAIFALRTGSVVVRADAIFSDDVTATLMPARTLRVVQRGVRIHYDAQRVRSEASLVDGGALEIGASFERYRDRFGFASNELRLLDGLRAQRVFAPQEVSGSGLPPGRLQQLLFTLWATQMLGVSDAEPTRAAVPQTVTGAPSQHGANAAAQLAQQLEAGTQPYALLGLDDDATADAISEAAARLLQSLLPDTADPALSGPASGELHGVVDRVRDAARRARASHVEAQGHRLVEAEGFAQATPLLEDLLKLRPGDPRTRSALAWCRFQTSTRSEREAKRAADAMEKILRDDDELARTHYYRGLLLRELGQNSAAVTAFTRAQELEPTNVDSQRQVDALRSAPRQKKAKSVSPGSSPSRSRTGGTTGLWKSDPPSHVLWTSNWKRVWAVVGVLLFVLLAAQIGLRLDI